MPAGTNENVKLTRVAYEPFKQDGTGDKVLKFEFVDEDGRQFVHNEWEIEPDRIKQNAKAWGKDYAELLEGTMRDTTERIKHIMSCFMPLREIKVKGSNWAEFAQAVIDNMGDKYQDIPVRIKLILNNKDYTRFPKRAINDFIQPMSHPNTITYNSKYDRTEPKSAVGSSDLDHMFDIDDAPVPLATREEDEGLMF